MHFPDAANRQTSRVPTEIAFQNEQQIFQVRAETLLLKSWENEPTGIRNDFLRLISWFPDLLGLPRDTRR